jgi:hypothetical protein
VPDRRRFRRVNVICAIVLACVGGKRRKRGQWGLGKEPRSGAVDSEYGASVGRNSQLERATIQRKRVVYTLKYSLSTTHAIITIMCPVRKVNIFSPLQVKN